MKLLHAQAKACDYNRKLTPFLSRLESPPLKFVVRHGASAQCRLSRHFADCVAYYERGD